MSEGNPLRSFSQLVSALGGGGDEGNLFPQSDADDLGHGARFIPNNVTLARRAGEKVLFVQNCSSCCWYWQMSDGSREYHWDQAVYEEIVRANGHSWQGSSLGNAGPCPLCGNPHTSGGTVTSDQINK